MSSESDTLKELLFNAEKYILELEKDVASYLEVKHSMRKAHKRIKDAYKLEIKILKKALRKYETPHL